VTAEKDGSLYSPPPLRFIALLPSPANRPLCGATVFMRFKHIAFAAPDAPGRGLLRLPLGLFLTNYSEPISATKRQTGVCTRHPPVRSVDGAASALCRAGAVPPHLNIDKRYSHRAVQGLPGLAGQPTSLERTRDDTDPRRPRPDSGSPNRLVARRLVGRLELLSGTSIRLAHWVQFTSTQTLTTGHGTRNGRADGS
jgi:hypothetical protein